MVPGSSLLDVAKSTFFSFLVAALFAISFFGAVILSPPLHHFKNPILQAAGTQPLQVSISPQISGAGLTVILSGVISDPNPGAQIAYSSVKVDWGDGTTTYGLWQGHVYKVPGPYSIKLDATDSFGAKGKATPSVNLFANGATSISVSYYPLTYQSAPKISFTPQVSGDGLLVSITGSIVDYNQNTQIKSVVWNWGDGVSTTGFYPQHVYFSPNKYSITATVYDTSGQAYTSDPQVVDLNQNAARSITPSTIASGGGSQSIQVSLGNPKISGLKVCPQGSVNDPPASSLKFVWNWGDSTAPQTTSGTWPCHTYSQSNTYTISLQVTDDIGGSTSSSVPVSVSSGSVQSGTGGSAITIQFNLNPSGLTVTPSWSVDDPPATTMVADWNWGDGTPDTIGFPNNLKHTYAKAGPYTVILSISDNLGQSSSASQPVSVTSSTSGISMNIRTPVINGNQVVPQGNIDDPAASSFTITWNWGDNSQQVTSYSDPWPTHSYSLPNQYQISVSALDNLGQLNTYTNLVTIGQGTTSSNSVSAISTQITMQTSGLKVSPQGVIDDPPASSFTVTWDWGDGHKQTTNNANSWPTHTYASAQPYTITVTVNDNLGGTSVSTYNVNPTTSASGGSLPIQVNVHVQTSGLMATPQGTINDNNPSATKLTILWSWGDGMFSNNWVSHQYLVPGTYPVKMTVTDDIGLSNTYSTSVTVS